MSPKGHAQIKGSADTVISLSYSYTTLSLKETSVSKVFGLWIHQNLWNIAIAVSNVSHCVLFLTRKNNFGSSCCATFFKLNNIFIENTPVYKQSLHEGLYSAAPKTDLWTRKSFLGYASLFVWRPPSGFVRIREWLCWKCLSQWDSVPALLSRPVELKSPKLLM